MMLSEDRNGPLRPVRATEGMDEDDQIECSPRGFARLRGIDVGLGQGGKKPTPESSDGRRVGTREDRDHPPERRVEHQGWPVEPRAAKASTVLRTHPADAHSPPEGSAKLVYVADRADISGHRGDHRFLVEADR